MHDSNVDNNKGLPQKHVSTVQICLKSVLSIFLKITYVKIIYSNKQSSLFILNINSDICFFFYLRFPICNMKFNERKKLNSTKIYRKIKNMAQKNG